MNHRTPPDVQIKRMRDKAKQKAMATPEAPFNQEELDYLKLNYPDLYDRVMAATSKVE